MATAGCRPESSRLRYTAGIATGIVRCGFDRWRRQRLWRVGKQLRGIIWHRLVRIDDRVRLRRWRAHATSEPAVPMADPPAAPRIRCSVCGGQLAAGRTIGGMTDDDADQPEPFSAKAITALLREARSVSRRAEKLAGTAATVDDHIIGQLAAEACTSMEQLVHHPMLLERQVQAGRRRPVVEPDSFLGGIYRGA